MIQKAILFFLFLIISWGRAQEMGASDEPIVAFEAKKTTEIDPDVHLFGIPLRSSEEQAMAVYGKPQMRIQFSEKLSAIVYQWNWALFFDLDKLCGITFTDGALDYRLMRFVKNYKNLWNSGEILWSLSNGIHHKMPKKEAKKILSKFANEKVTKYGAFYQSKRSAIEISFTGSNNDDKKDDFGEVFAVTVMEKAPYEEFNRYRHDE